MARALQARLARSRPPGPGNEPEHPEWMERWRAARQGRRRGEKSRLVRSAPGRAYQFYGRAAEAPKPRQLLPRPVRPRLSAPGRSRGWNIEAAHLAELPGESAAPRAGAIFSPRFNSALP